MWSEIVYCISFPWTYFEKTFFSFVWTRYISIVLWNDLKWKIKILTILICISLYSDAFLSIQTRPLFFSLNKYTCFPSVTFQNVKISPNGHTERIRRSDDSSDSGLEESEKVRRAQNPWLCFFLTFKIKSSFFTQWQSIC